MPPLCLLQLEVAKSLMKKQQAQSKQSLDKLAARIMRQSLQFGRDKLVAVYEKRRTTSVRSAALCSICRACVRPSIVVRHFVSCWDVLSGAGSVSQMGPHDQAEEANRGHETHADQA